MAIDGDEDTVMGDAGPSITHPLGTSHLRREHSPRATLNGRADPVLGPSPLAQSQSLRVPLPPRPDSHLIRDTSSAGDSRPMSPAKLSWKLPGDDALGEYLEKDSLVEENSDFEEEESTGLPVEQLPSGLCYDVRMRYHCEVRPTADVHPEDPRRIWYIYKELCRAGLVDDPEYSSRPLAPKPLKRILARDATEEEISMVHGMGHYLFVQSTGGMCLLCGGLV